MIACGQPTEKHDITTNIIIYLLCFTIVAKKTIFAVPDYASNPYYYQKNKIKR